MTRIPEQNLNYLVSSMINGYYIKTKRLHQCQAKINIAYHINNHSIGRGIYKGDKIHGKASTKKFDPLSNRSRKFKPKPKLQDGIDISKELAQQKSTTSGEYSFDLELGASASKVYQRQKEKEMMESLKPSSCLQKLPKGIDQYRFLISSSVLNIFACYVNI